MADALVFGFNLTESGAKTTYAYSDKWKGTVLARDSIIKPETLIGHLYVDVLNVLVQGNRFAVMSSNPLVPLDECDLRDIRICVLPSVNEPLSDWAKACERVIACYRDGYVLQVPQPAGSVANVLTLVKRVG